MQSLNQFYRRRRRDSLEKNDTYEGWGSPNTTTPTTSPPASLPRNQGFLSRVYGDFMEDIQENERYIKCDKYGEISNPRLGMLDPFDKEGFAKQLRQSSLDSTESADNKRLKNNHHHHSIQELIRHFSQRVHSWRRASIGERDRKPAVNEASNEFRGRSRSLGAAPSPLDDCAATYRIYDDILREGCSFVLVFFFLIIRQQGLSFTVSYEYENFIRYIIFEFESRCWRMHRCVTTVCGRLR